MYMQARVLITACTLILAAPVHAGQTVEGRHLDRSAIVSLLHASDVAGLDKVYKTLHANAGIDILYRSLRLRMQPNQSNELALLNTIPKAFDDYLLYRALDDPGPSSEDVSTLSNVVDGYFERVARLAVKNGADLRSYLVLHAFTDGYARTDSQEWLDWLLRNHRKAVLSAFQALDAKTKSAICGDDCTEFEQQ